MPQLINIKPLIFYANTPSVRIFQQYAGESMERLDQYDVWDIITVLCQAVALANMVEVETIDIPETIEALGDEMEFRDHCKKCLDALNGFPTSQVNTLMVGILAVAFEV